MKDKRYLFWDLDGTLTDPAEGITKSVQHALRCEGILVEDRTALYPFIGPPLRDAFMEQYGFSAGQAESAIVHYREYFSQTGIFENKVYPGIPSLLGELRAAGIRLILATSKPAVFARRILEHFDLLSCFTVLCGSELDGLPHPEGRGDPVRAGADRRAAGGDGDDRRSAVRYRRRPCLWNRGGRRAVRLRQPTGIGGCRERRRWRRIFRRCAGFFCKF